MHVLLFIMPPEKDPTHFIMSSLLLFFFIFPRYYLSSVTVVLDFDHKQ